MIVASQSSELAALQSELPVLSLLAKLDAAATTLCSEVPADQDQQLGSGPGTQGAAPRVSLVVKEGLQVRGRERKRGCEAASQ